MTDFRVTFHVPGQAVGKGRPRFVKATGRAYTPGPTLTYENLVKNAAADAMQDWPPFDGPVSLTILVDVLVSESWPTWKRAAALAGRIMPTGKPDSDNLLKLISDAINKVVWVDDAQVCDCEITKRFSEKAGVTVKVVSLPAAPQSITRKSDLEAI